MTNSILLFLASGFTSMSAAAFVRSAQSATSRRRWAMSAALISLLCTIPVALLPSAQHAEGGIASLLDIACFPILPAFAATVGLAAIALSPLSSPVGTWRRLLLANGTGILLFGAAHPLLVAVIWSIEAALAWSELSAQKAARTRLIGLHLGGATIAGLAGAGLLEVGQTSAGCILLVLAIAVRAGLLPWQSWLIDFVEGSPLGMVVAICARQSAVHVAFLLVLPRLEEPLLGAMAAAGAVTALFAAALSVIQMSARRALAYLLISLSALVIFGLGIGTQLGQAATRGTWVAMGLASAGFIMALGALEARRGRLRLDRPSGSYARVPRLATAFLLLGLASVGLPGTFSFVTEDLLFSAAIGPHPTLTIIAILATALCGITVIRCFFYLFSGEREPGGEGDLLPHEWLVMSWLLFLLLAEGLWPAPALSAVLPH